MAPKFLAREMLKELVVHENRQRKQLNQAKNNILNLAEGWGELILEYYDENGKIVRVFENGCSIIGQPNSEANHEIIKNILRFLVENPSILENEHISRGEGNLQIHFRD